MKKIIIGIVWVVILWYVFGFVGASIGGFIGGIQGLSMEETMAKYSTAINLFSLMLAIIVGVVGTIKEKLPFTK
jgi:hypothetical protein